MKALRQGRGSGYLAALAKGPAAASDVVACVLDDPRWEHQLESRDDYYARLLLALDADIETIARHVIENEPGEPPADHCLPICVLASMAWRGHEPATRALRTAIEQGREVDFCIEVIESRGGRALLAKVMGRAWIEQPDSEEFESSEPSDEVRRLLEPGALAGIGSEALFDLMLDVRRLLRPARSELATRSDSVTTPLLLEIAASATGRRRGMAFWLLGARGYTGWIGEAEAYIRHEVRTGQFDPSTRVQYLDYVENLPGELALPLARRWLSETPPLLPLALPILSRHATAADRELLEEVGRTLLLGGQMYELADVLEGLLRVPSEASLPFLFDIWEEAPYAWNRRRALEAMLATQTTNSAVDDLVSEALWDCESDTRAIACGAASRLHVRPDAVKRIWALASDPFEEEEVRTAARKAIG